MRLPGTKSSRSLVGHVFEGDVSGPGDDPESAVQYTNGYQSAAKVSSSDQSGRPSDQSGRPPRPKLKKRLWHSLSKGPPLLASYFVPDEAREKFSDRSIITIGGSLLFVNIAAFILLIVFYGECHKTTILTIHPEDGSINTERDCVVEQLLHTEGISMDQRGRWSGEWNFRPAEAFWRFEFVRFRNTDAGFRRNISGVIDKLYDELETLKGHRYYEVIQLLRFSNITVDGTEGYVRIAPNFNLQFAIRNKLTDWSQARDMSRWVNLGRPITPEEEAAAVRGSRPDACDGTTVVVGYDHLQIKGNRAISVLPSPLFSPTMDYYMYNYTAGNGTGGSGTCVRVDIVEGEDVASVPILGDISQRNGRQAYRSLEWDTSQIVALDFCNKYREKCLTFFRVPTSPRAVIAGVFVSAGSSESLPSAYSPTLDKYGYIWTNGVYAGIRDPATGALAWNNRTFFVVPQLLADDTCASCNSTTAPEIDCQSFLAIELHMYLLNVPGDNQAWVKSQLPADWVLAPGLLGPYFVTFEYALRLASGFNEDLVHPEMQCDVSSMGFLLDRPTLYNVTTFPFQLTSGVYSCRVYDCASFLQRLANAWSNVELLYVICVNVIVFYVFTRFTYNLRWRKPKPTPTLPAIPVDGSSRTIPTVGGSVRTSAEP
eukprot:jgi/Mesvir1/15188/Mv06427-RA.1